MTKYARPALKWLVLTLFLYMSAHMILSLFNSYPQAAYDRNNQRYPLSKDCAAISVDMDLPTALKILLQKGEPTFQHLENGRLIVRRGEVQCTVEFDITTHKVAKVESNVFPTFDPRYK